MTEEQITIQLGPLSNFVGVHFWNLQREVLSLCRSNEEKDEKEVASRLEEEAEEEEESVKDGKRGSDLIDEKSSYQVEQLFRRRRDGDVSPRVLMIDSRGCLGSLNQAGGSASADLQGAHSDTWDQNKISVFQQPNREPSQGISHHGANSTWSDNLNVTLSPGSAVELPFWPFAEQFKTFSSGYFTNTISSDVREDYFDRIRKYSEECDYLRNITVFADLYDGFGGLACSLIEEIRDEMPRVTLPVWGFSEDPVSQTATETEDGLGKLHIQKYNIPLCYSSLSEYASVVVPISPSACLESSPFVRPSTSSLYDMSSVIANALELATGFSRVFDSRRDMQSSGVHQGEWAHCVTANSRYKFCNLEVCAPFPLQLSGAKSSEMLKYLWSTYESEDQRRQSSYSMNPFMRSLSSSVHGDWSVSSMELEKVRVKAPFSNFMTIRGCQIDDLPRQIFQKSMRSKNVVSNIHTRKLGLPFPDRLVCQSASSSKMYSLTVVNSTPPIFGGTDSTGHISPASAASPSVFADELFPPSSFTVRDSLTCSPHNVRLDGADGMASVGCDGAVMGRHLGIVSEHWSSRRYKCKLQLEQTGFTDDDCKEIEENLSRLEDAYI